MFSILGLITGLGGPLINLGSQITSLMSQRAQAKTEEEIAAINARVEALHDRRAVLIAEAGTRAAAILNSSMRLLLALGPMLYLNKIFIWDKVIGSWPKYSTDPLDTNLWWVVIAVIGFYFLATWKK